MQGGATGAMFAQVGNVTAGQPIKNIIGHAVAGCASAVMGDGDCGRGAVSAAAGAAWSNYVPQSGMWGVDLAGASLAGGLTSKLSGGSFEEGAVSAAYGFAFNQFLHPDSVTQFGWADMPTVPQPVLDFTTGVADAASLGLGPLARQALGVDGGVDRSSSAYSAGEQISLYLGAGRMVYAGFAKVGAAMSADGMAALAFRNNIKRAMRGPLWFSNYRIKNYGDMLLKYGSDEAVQRAAGRTNVKWNAAGANSVIGGSQCTVTSGCP